MPRTKRKPGQVKTGPQQKKQKTEETQPTERITRSKTKAAEARKKEELKSAEEAKVKGEGRPELKTKEAQKLAEKAEEEVPEILEQGFIYFFYKPKVNVEEPETKQDVQRMVIVLKPWQLEEKTEPKLRMIVIPKKKLPSLETHEQEFAKIVAVGSVEEMKKGLEERIYETETRGEQKQPAARPLGEGIYHLTWHKKHTHLVYQLILPKEPGELQESFNIKNEGSFVIQVKNPKEIKEKIDIGELQEKVFGDRKFCPAKPPELLNFENMELILIGAKEDVVKELGKTGKILKEEAKVIQLEKEDFFKQLNLDRKQMTEKPLTE